MSPPSLPNMAQAQIGVFDYTVNPGRFVTLVLKVITFSYSMAQQLWELLLNLNWLVQFVKCPNVSNTNFNLRGNFV